MSLLAFYSKYGKRLHVADIVKLNFIREDCVLSKWIARFVDRVIESLGKSYFAIKPKFEENLYFSTKPI